MKKAATESVGESILLDFSFPGNPEIPSVTIQAENVQEAEDKYAEFLKSLRSSKE